MSSDAAIQDLHDKFDGWRISRSRNGGCLVATRTDRVYLTQKEFSAGMAMTVIENTAEQLQAKLRQQVDFENSVWRG